MRVISGRAKGKRLKAPSGMDTRPITDMIKEALFNVLGANVVNAKFLDLFAGSGSVGIEALSRDAQTVVFVDYSQDAIKTIKDNLNHCSLLYGYEIYKNDVVAAVKRLKKRQLLFDFIYVDPPFTQENIFPKIMTVLDEAHILEPDGTLIIRTPKKMHLQEKFNKITRFRVSNYGESTLNYYQIIKEVNNNNGNSAYY